MGDRRRCHGPESRSLFGNDRRLRTILGYYLGDRSLSMLRCCTTASPNGARNLEAEDLAAIPDLVGGALVELFSELANRRSEASESLTLPDPEALSSKTRQILAWLRGPKRLSHLVYTVRSAGSGQIRVTDVDMGEPIVQLARPDVEEQWAIEAERRWRQIEGGEVETIPWEGVRAKLFRRG
jgi:hypothetical protein